MDKLKTFFNKLQVDIKSAVLNDKLLKKLKNSKYEKDKEFVNRFNLLEDKKTDFINKNVVYSVSIKAKKSDKVYVYGMKNSSLIPLKFEKFYKEVANKRRNKEMRLQTDLEFEQKKIFALNKKYNVDMFSTAVRGGKAFAAKQKLRELKKRLSRLLALQRNSKAKLKSPNVLIQKAVENMNSLPTVKCGVEPDKVEKKSLESKAYIDWFNTRRLHIVSKAHARYERYEKSKYGRKKKKYRESLEIAEDVLSLSSRTKKKNDLGKFYKSTVDNRPLFDKNAIFTITNRLNIDNKTFYWIKNKKTNKKVLLRVMREEIYALTGNFL